MEYPTISPNVSANPIFFESICLYPFKKNGKKSRREERMITAEPTRTQRDTFINTNRKHHMICGGDIVILDILEIYVVQNSLLLLLRIIFV